MAELVDRAAQGLADLSEEISEQLGRPPSLTEFLEILGWAVPAAPGVPTRFEADGPGESDLPNESGELNDATFADAASLVSELGRPSAQDTADLVLRGLQQAGSDVLADVDPADITRIRAVESHGADIGDVVGIPARAGGHFPAVILAKNRIGTALGLFKSPGPVSAKDHPPVHPRPVYTGEQLIANGHWPRLGHDDELRKLFPSDPEIYHRPADDMPELDLGPYGSAEKPDGTLRELTEEEAREVGLLDGTYRQSWLPDHLQDHLNGDTQ